MTTTMEPAPTSALAKPKRILMIDDDDMMRILFREMFWIYSDPGKTEVEAIPSIEAAYEKLKKMPHPDVVVLGLSLLTKGVDGIAKRATLPSLEFIKNMKAENAATKLIVYSQHSEPELKEKAREAGADDYLVKGEHAPREIVNFIEGL